MKLIIDIPEKALNVLKNEGVDWLGAEHILDAVSKGIPYEDRPQGEWIKHRGYNADGFGVEYSCSECNEWNDEKSRYCPNCGADMRGGRE